MTTDRELLELAAKAAGANEMTTTDYNFCARCGKPIWHSDASAIHTCTPPDKTRQGTHWDGCEETRGHHDCAIRKIAALRAEIERQREVISQINRTNDHLGMTVRDIKAERDALKAAIDEARGRGMAGSGDA